jgi:hypothetical protein
MATHDAERLEGALAGHRGLPRSDAVPALPAHGLPVPAGNLARDHERCSGLDAGRIGRPGSAAPEVDAQLGEAPFGRLSGRRAARSTLSNSSAL